MKSVVILLALGLASAASAHPVAGKAVDAGGQPLRSSCSLSRLDAVNPRASLLDCVISDGRAAPPSKAMDNPGVVLMSGVDAKPKVEIISGAPRSPGPTPTNLALRVLITDPPKAVDANPGLVVMGGASGARNNIAVIEPDRRSRRR